MQRVSRTLVIFLLTGFLVSCGEAFTDLASQNQPVKSQVGSSEKLALDADESRFVYQAIAQAMKALGKNPKKIQDGLATDIYEISGDMNCSRFEYFDKKRQPAALPKWECGFADSHTSQKRVSLGQSSANFAAKLETISGLSNEYPMEDYLEDGKPELVGVQYEIRAKIVCKDTYGFTGHYYNCEMTRQAADAARSMVVHYPSTVARAKQLMKDHHITVVVSHSYEVCGPCRLWKDFVPGLAAVAKEHDFHVIDLDYDKLVFAHEALDTVASKRIAQEGHNLFHELRVSTLPSVAVFRGGVLIDHTSLFGLGSPEEDHSQAVIDITEKARSLSTLEMTVLMGAYQVLLLKLQEEGKIKPLN